MQKKITLESLDEKIRGLAIGTIIIGIGAVLGLICIAIKIWIYK